MKRHITGQEIVELFEWTEHELIEAVQGGLAVYDTIYGKKNDNHCLYCDGGAVVDQSMLIDRNVKSELKLMASRADGVMDTLEASFKIRRCTLRDHYPVPFPWLCRDEWKREEIAKRLLKASFVTAEVQEHALTHNLPALGQTIPAANEPGQDPQSEKGSNRPVEILPTIPGTAWDQIKIRIAKNDRIEIERPGFDMVFHNAKDLGLNKARVMLFILKSFGFYDGELKRDIIKEVNAANISNLRKHLKRIFPDIEDDPIICKESSTYVCQFQISTNKEEFSRDHYTGDEVQDEGEDWEELMGAKN